MRSKGLWVLLSVFLVLVVVASLYTLKERRPHTRALYPTVEADSVLMIQISKGDTTCVFEKDDDKWELTKPLSYPADQAPLRNLLKSLTTLEPGEVISINPDKFPKFQVDEKSGVLVEAYGRGEKPLISVILGKMGSDFQSCYLRFPRKDEVHVARGISRYMADRKVDDWRDKTILSLDKEKVVQITCMYPKREFRLLKAEGEWMLGKREADSTKVSEVLNFLSDFKADGFKDGGEVKAQLTLRIELEDGTEQKLLIGEEDEKGKYLAQRGGAETTFWIHSWKVDRLKKRREDFLKP